MKNVFLILILVLSTEFLIGSPRVFSSINENWKFAQGDFQDVKSNNFDDSKWERISIPHTWNKTDADDETPGYFRGVSWYRRTILMPAEYSKKQVFIYFDGANQETELFVNGKIAGSHSGGYTRFCFDITNLLNFGSQNLFVLKVNNSHNDNIPPLSADFTFFGGVYRDINLIITEKQHISTNYFGSSGVFISTPKVSEKEAYVSIKTMVTNDGSDATKLRLENSILTKNGELINKTTVNFNIAGKASQNIGQKEIKIVNPSLWSPYSPTLYTVLTQIYDAKTNKLLDEVINPLGFRWYEFSAENGFFLNGKPLKLIGTNRHQCFLNLGNALSDELHIRDIKLLKDMGANFLRISHYPQDQTVMEMCDKLGILCSVEIPIVNAITESEAFTSHSLNMAREMVMQDYNRPSVIIWAYMNEVLLRLPFKEDSVRNAQYFKSVGQLATKIEKQIRQDDPTRYTMIPFHGNLDVYKEAGLVDIPKIIGFNLYQGWYGGTFDGFDTFLDKAKEMITEKPFIISEYGADVDPRLHSFNPQRMDYTQEYANLYHEHYIKSILKRPNVAGAFIWNLNDFYSEERAYAVPHVNSKGIVGMNREVKDTYLQYQALLLKTPFVCIGGTNWKIRGGNADINGTCLQTIKVYSNQKSIELFHNEKSLGNQLVINNIAMFNVPFVNGKNVLFATSDENKMICNQLTIDFRTVPFNLKDTLNLFTEINVMLGSKRYFEDKTNSVIWIPEKEYSSGSWGYIGGKPYEKKTRHGSQSASDLDILDTSNDPVFQTQRVDIEVFKLDVPDGKYTVSLYFAELQSDKEIKALIYNLGNDAVKEDFVKRSFDVDINNVNVIKNLDLTKEFGAQYAVIKKFEIEVTNNKGITVSFKKEDGKPVLNAIRVYRNY